MIPRREPDGTRRVASGQCSYRGSKRCGRARLEQVRGAADLQVEVLSGAAQVQIDSTLLTLIVLPTLYEIIEQRALRRGEED